MADAPETTRTGVTAERLRLERLAMLASQPGRPERMTYDDFLAWADEDTRAEWVLGKVIMPSPASARHQAIQLFLARLIALFADATGTGRVIQAPFQMRLAPSGREPDLLFVSKEHLDRIRDTYLDGPADLAIEIVSPDSGERDRVEKLSEYQAGGVREYWIVDPVTHEVDFYQLDASGHYRRASADASGIYRPPVLPGFWLDVAWLWQEPLPNYIKAMKQIDRAAYERYAGD